MKASPRRGRRPGAALAVHQEQTPGLLGDVCNCPIVRDGQLGDTADRHADAGRELHRLGEKALSHGIEWRGLQGRPAARGRISGGVTSLDDGTVQDLGRLTVLEIEQEDRTEALSPSYGERGPAVG